jgi:hypothetical protein
MGPITTTCSSVCQEGQAQEDRPSPRCSKRAQQKNVTFLPCLVSDVQFAVSRDVSSEELFYTPAEYSSFRRIAREKRQRQKARVAQELSKSQQEEESVVRTIRNKQEQGENNTNNTIIEQTTQTSGMIINGLLVNSHVATATSKYCPRATSTSRRDMSGNADRRWCGTGARGARISHAPLA